MGTTASSTPSAARAEEQAFLKRALAPKSDTEVRNGGVVVAVQGPSGIGKTHLVDHILRGYGTADRSMFTRIDAPVRLNHQSFRSIVLTAVLREYVGLLEGGADLPLKASDRFSKSRKRALSSGATALIDGVTFGGATALKSLYTVFKSHSSTAFDDLVLDDTEAEEAIEALFVSLSDQVLLSIAVANAQRLPKKELSFVFRLAQSWGARVVLEYTMTSFDVGIINREELDELAQAHGAVASAMTLAPLRWTDAHRLNSSLSEGDIWARQYYERHGYNLFDLRNLMGPEAQDFETSLFEDLSFGPTTLPGLISRFPATRQKIGNLSRDEQFLLCAIGLHGGFVREDVLDQIAPAHLTPQLVNVVNALRRAGLVSLRPGHSDVRAYTLAHDSVWLSIEDQSTFIPLLKLAAKCWQGFYEQRPTGDPVVEGHFELERLIRLAYFSALIGDSQVLLSSCQALSEISKTAVIEGGFRDSFRAIMFRTVSTALIPSAIKPLITYFLGAAALNFNDAALAEEALHAMPQNLLGARVLEGFVCLRSESYVKSTAAFSSVQKNARHGLDADEAVRIELAQVLNAFNTARDAKEISASRDAYRKLVERVCQGKESSTIVLKHCSIGYGYEESLPLLDDAITALQEAGKSFDADQTRLIKLMQLTRLGQLQEAKALADMLKNRFPRNFGEIANLWNILGILECYDEQSGFPAASVDRSSRQYFLRASQQRTDEYSQLVLASNLFVYDHFIAGGLVSSEERAQSMKTLEAVLEHAEIGFRYLYNLGWYNLMRFWEGKGERDRAATYREMIGPVEADDSLLWRVAMGGASGKHTEVEFLTKTPFMFAFLPNHNLSPPTFENCADRISRIISV